MITSNVLTRVFKISDGESEGTAFTIEVDKKQYLVTAKHVISNFSGGSLQLYHSDKWTNIKFELVGHSEYTDVSVLAADKQLSPEFELPTTSEHIVLGQPVYFLGFPFDHVPSVPDNLNGGYPVALIKGGTLSALVVDDDISTLLIDGNNNPGLSGGPVVFIKNGRPPYIDSNFCVGGIISGYQAEKKAVQDENSAITGHYIHENSGIVFAYNIKHALELINKNPIGYRL